MKSVFACYMPRLPSERRICAIDLLKLFAALLVVLSHCLQIFTDAGTNGLLFNAVWLVHMPLFMIASGMVACPSKEIQKPVKHMFRLLRNILCLLWPSITFLAIKCAIHNQNFVTSLGEFFMDPQTGLWFLWVLFAIHCIFDLGVFLSDILKIRFRWIAPISLLACCSFAFLLLIRFNIISSSLLGAKLIAYYSWYFLAGAAFRLAAKTQFASSQIMAWVGIILAILLTGVFLFLLLKHRNFIDMSDSSLGGVAIRVVASLSGSYVLIVGMGYLSLLKPIEKISWAGRFSLQSYYIHVLVNGLISLHVDGAAQQALLVVGMFALLVSIVTAVVAALYFVPFGNLVLFGRSYSFYKFEKRIPQVFR